MGRKKEPEKAANHERWLVSYADFITLLFAVFVTLYAMSQTDKKKVEQVAASYRSAFGVTTGANSGRPQLLNKTNVMPIPSMRDKMKAAAEQAQGKGEAQGKREATKKEFKEILISLEKFLNEKHAQDQVQVTITQRGLVISLKEAGFFDSGSAGLKASGQEVLAKMGEMLRPWDNQVRFEGHTDNVPMHSAVYQTNWELSTARATALARYFVEHQGLNPERVGATGYGEFRPVADNATDEGRRQNRRVDLVVLGPDAAAQEVEETPPAPQTKAQAPKLPL